MCRHAVVVHLMDITTGERYIYAAIMLYCLLVTYAVSILVVWYDINCKFGGYFARWAKGIAELQSALSRLPGGLPRFPLPVFHRYSHRWEPTLWLSQHAHCGSNHTDISAKQYKLGCNFNNASCIPHHTQHAACHHWLTHLSAAAGLCLPCLAVLHVKSAMMAHT